MYHRGMKWEEYLELRGFKDDIVHGLERQTQNIATVRQQAAWETTHALDQGFGALVASREEMIDVMEIGFGAISYELERVSAGIEALHADFNWAMGAVLWKLEMQHKTLQDILATLQAPLDTQAKELRHRAEEAYLNGWYEEALNDLLKSAEKNYQDFAVHQAIGNIYLYQRRPAELEKAREAYLKAGKYAEPRSDYHAALGYMHAGFVCYLQGDDDTAIEYACRATELHPQLIEAFYNHAKFAAAAGQTALAIPSLETAIRADRRYAVKAHADADFENIETAVAKLMERLIAEVRSEAAEVLRRLRKRMSDYVMPGVLQEQLNCEMAAIQQKLVDPTYFDACTAQEQAGECEGRWRGIAEQGYGEVTLHTKPPNALAFSPDGTVLAACSPAGTVRLWDAVKGHALAVLKGHSGNIHTIAFSPDGETLASCSSDKAVRLWEVASGRAWAVLEGHSGDVRTIAFSPDGETLASGSSDGTVRLWDVPSGHKRAVLSGHTDKVHILAFSTDGEMLASGSSDKTVRLWDVAGGRERFVLSGHSDIHTLAFSSDGATLVSGNRWYLVGTDFTIRQKRRDLAAGPITEEQKREMIAELKEVRKRSELARRACELLRKSNELRAAGRAEELREVEEEQRRVEEELRRREKQRMRDLLQGVTIHLWDVATGRERTTLEGNSDWLRGVAFNPDGTTIVLAFYAGPGAERLQGEFELVGHELNHIAFSPDGMLLATSASGSQTVQMWDISSGQGIELMTIEKHSRPVRCIAISPDGKTLASGSNDRTVRLWCQVVKRQAWERLKREREDRAHKAQQRRERVRRERERQRQTWQATGRCEECGAKLGFFEKLAGHTQCEEHR